MTGKGSADNRERAGMIAIGPAIATTALLTAWSLTY
jgi:hypothetical protein